MIENTFWSRVQSMYNSGPVGPSISNALRDFGFSTDRDEFLQLIHLRRSFIQNPVGMNAFHGRPNRVKLRHSIVMQWKYTMWTVDVAHRLIMNDSLPKSSFLRSQQMMLFNFHTARRWNIFLDTGLHCMEVWWILKNFGRQFTHFLTNGIRRPTFFHRTVTQCRMWWKHDTVACD